MARRPSPMPSSCRLRLLGIGRGSGARARGDRTSGDAPAAPPISPTTSARRRSATARTPTPESSCSTGSPAARPSMRAVADAFVTPTTTSNAAPVRSRHDTRRHDRDRTLTTSAAARRRLPAARRPQRPRGGRRAVRWARLALCRALGHPEIAALVLINPATLPSGTCDPRDAQRDGRGGHRGGPAPRSDIALPGDEGSPTRHPAARRCCRCSTTAWCRCRRATPRLRCRCCCSLVGRHRGRPVQPRAPRHRVRRPGRPDPLADPQLPRRHPRTTTAAHHRRPRFVADVCP